MAGGSISPPGVEVTQEFVTSSPTPITPAMPTVLVAPCFQSVDAFDDNGNPQAEALAGIYRDGLGLIAYSLPSLLAQASLVGFESDIRVFLRYGTETRELNSVGDESVVIDDATTGVYTDATKKLVDASQTFLQLGVEAGDVVRLTWRDELMDIPIASVDSDTELTLESSMLDEDIATVSYDVVRSAAEFVFDAAAQANVEIGSAADYLRFAATTLKTDAETPADYIGSLGDSLTVKLIGTERFLSGTDGAVGDSIFSSATATFLTSAGARGAITGKSMTIGAIGDAAVFYDVLYAVSDTKIIIESGAGVGLSGQTYVVLTETDTGTNGATDGAGTTFSSAGATFLTNIPNTAGTPDNTTYIEIEGVGVYAITAIPSETTLTISGTVATQSLTDQTFTIGYSAGTAADGATGVLTDFVSISQDLTTITAPTTKSVNLGTEANAIASVTDADALVLSAGMAASGADLDFFVVITTADLIISWDGDTDTATIQMARVAGLSTTTYANIVAALTTPANPAYNELVSDALTAALGGSVGDGSTVVTDVVLGATGLSLALDGGADDDQLILDADLLGSATPTAQVYVSYKALRLDVSDQAEGATLLAISSESERESLLGPATLDNPLGLMAYYALLNSPTRTIYALGVSAITAAKPFGTLEAYGSAFDFLTSQDVYCVVPGTNDPAVAAALKEHVEAMSQPSEKAERIGFVSTPMPEFKNADILASGTDGNTLTVVGQATAEFSASIDFEAQGVQAGDILVVGSLASTSDSPSGVDGTVGPLYGVVVTGIKAGDPFVLEFDGTVTGVSANWNNLVDVGFTVYRAGAAISQASDQAEVIAQVGEGLATRRIYHHWPDKITADVAGVASVIDGFYLMAMWGGKVNEAAAYRGMTRASVAGATGTKNSNDYFSRSQLDRIAGGGTWITVQEGQNSPLRCRHQLSTDVSSIEKREFSITRIVDYTSKYLRNGLNRQVGKFNITQSYLDSLASSVQGLLTGLIQANVLNDAKLVSIAVNDVQPDMVDIVVSIDVPYPANYINITLQV